VATRFPSRAEIRTNQTITVQLIPKTGGLATDTNDPITVASTDSPYVIDGIEFGDILITNNSGSVAAIKILIRDSQY
jgi:hypothetical protein